MHRSTGPTRTLTLESESNRLQSVTTGQRTGHYAYDDAGNLTEENQSRRFAWNHADRMTNFSEGPRGREPVVHARYLYAADGMRVKKWVRKRTGPADGESTSYIDGLIEHTIWRRGGQTGENNHLHVKDDHRRIALIRVGPAHPDDKGEPVQYHLADHFGSTALVVGGLDTRASMDISREEYIPYGETSFGGHTRKRYRYSSKERDEESALYYFGARYYEPFLCRWLSSDPAGAVDGPNLYQYVRANPLRVGDPSGLQGAIVEPLVAPSAAPPSAAILPGAVAEPMAAPAAQTSRMLAGRALQFGINLARTAALSAEVAEGTTAAAAATAGSAAGAIGSAVVAAAVPIAGTLALGLVLGAASASVVHNAARYKYDARVGPQPDLSHRSQSTLPPGFSDPATSAMFLPGRAGDPYRLHTDLSAFNLPLGGSYGELSAVWTRFAISNNLKGYSELGIEIHHVPSNSASHYSTAHGPAIVMLKEDHAKTHSYRNASNVATEKKLSWKDRAYLGTQDIHDLHDHTYDQALSEMWDYILEIDP